MKNRHEKKKYKSYYTYIQGNKTILFIHRSNFFGSKNFGCTISAEGNYNHKKSDPLNTKIEWLALVKEYLHIRDQSSGVSQCSTEHFNVRIWDLETENRRAEQMLNAVETDFRRKGCRLSRQADIRNDKRKEWYA